MEHSVIPVGSPPLPDARVFYEPEYQVLDIENGQPSEVGEELARGIHIMYGEDFSDAPALAVSILIERAEWALKPFMDAVLQKHGITPDLKAPQQRHKKGHRETVITQIRGEEWTLAPYSEAVYDTASQTLLIENGETCEVTKEMAKDVHVLYGKDYDGGARLASVGIRIDHAETLLKPFVDAILTKYTTKDKEDAPHRASHD